MGALKTILTEGLFASRCSIKFSRSLDDSLSIHFYSAHIILCRKRRGSQIFIFYTHTINYLNLQTIIKINAGYAWTA